MDFINSGFGLYVDQTPAGHIPWLIVHFDIPFRERLWLTTALLKLCHGKKTRRWYSQDRRRVFRFPSHVFHAGGIKPHFLFREPDNLLILTLHVPAMVNYVKRLPAPIRNALLGGRPLHDNLIQDAVLHNAAIPWYRWHAAYQLCGFYLFAESIHLGGGDWIPATAFEQSIFLLEDFDLTELGDRTAIDAGLRLAKSQLEGGTQNG